MKDLKHEHKLNSIAFSPEENLVWVYALMKNNDITILFGTLSTTKLKK